MAEKIMDRHTSEHYVWGNGCDSWVLANTEGMTVKQESMPAGTRELLHFHTHAQQFFFILKGSGTFYINNEVLAVAEHKGVLIRPGTRHFIANETETQLEFLVISQPSTNNDRIRVE